MLEETAASMICLSSVEEGEEEEEICELNNTSKFGNSSYEIFGTNPNSKRKTINLISSLSDNNNKNEDDDDDDDLMCIEAEINMNKNKLLSITNNKSVISINESESRKDADFYPEIDSESEDFNNWLMNGSVEPKTAKESELAVNNVFSIFNKPNENDSKQQQKLNTTESTKVSNIIVKNSNWIIVDSSLLQSAAVNILIFFLLWLISFGKSQNEFKLVSFVLTFLFFFAHHPVLKNDD